MPFLEETYDAITVVGVLSYREDKGYPNFQTLPECIHILKYNGYLVFTVSKRVWKAEQKNYEATLKSLPVKVVENIERPYHEVILTMQCIVVQKVS